MIIARWRGAEPIVADVRKTDGVEHFIDTSSSDIPGAVLELTGGRGADLALDTRGGALFEPTLRSLRFDGRMVGIFNAQPRVEFDLTEIYSRQLQVTGLASVFMDGGHVARIFDQLGALFDRGVLTPPAIKTWPLEKSEPKNHSPARKRTAPLSAIRPPVTISPSWSTHVP